jgi:DNA-directed RNA polymerase specialized sigma24 family protein
MDGTNTDSEKVEQLTDIFHDITGESSTTERQHEDRWASVSADNSDVDTDDTSRSIVREMTDEYEIQTSLDEDELGALVRQYHAGKSDTEIARALGSSSRDKTVARARISLHLFRDTDFDAPFELSRLRELLDQDTPTGEIADILSASKSTVRAYVRVLTAETEAERASHEYQSRFEQALTDTETDSDDTDQFSETVSPTAYASGLEDAVGSS